MTLSPALLRPACRLSFGATFCFATTRNYTCCCEAATIRSRRSRTERPGFEPGSHLLGSYAISSRVLSTAQTPLHCKGKGRVLCNVEGAMCNEKPADDAFTLHITHYTRGGASLNTAERVGCEPTRALQPYRFSRPALSTAQPPLQQSVS